MVKTRLERLQQYLIKAEADPENNKLYIEDLKVSIEYAKLNPDVTYTNYEVKTGFNIDNQIENM